MGRQVPIRAGVGASGPAKGEFLRQRFLSAEQAGGLSARPPCTPFGSPTEAIERPIWLQALLPRRSRRVKPHQRGISSAKLSLIDASRGLSARPPAPLRIATRSNRAPHRAASPALAPESARQAPPKGNFFGKVVSCHASRGLSARPLHPFGKSAYQWDKRICAYGHTKWLSSGQTIGEALTQREPP